MTVGIIDFLESVHIKHNENLVSAFYHRCPVQITCLIEKPGQSVQLIPHLIAVDIIQNPNQRHTQPGGMNLRESQLNEHSQNKKPHQRIDQNFTSVLIENSRCRRCHCQINNPGRKCHDIDMEMSSAEIDIVRSHAEHASERQACCQKNGISNPDQCRRFPDPECLSPLVQNMYQTKRHGRRQTKAKIIGQKIDKAIFRRSTIHDNRDHLQHGNCRNQNIGS